MGKLKVCLLPFLIFALQLFGLLGCGSVNSTATVANGSVGEETNTESNINSTNSLIVQDKAFTTDTNQELLINLSTLVDNADATKNYTFTIVSAPNIGLIAMDNELMTYTPSEIGSDKIQYKVSDGTNDSNIGTITIVIKTIAVIQSTNGVLVLIDKPLITMQDEEIEFNLSSMIKNFDSNSIYNFAVTSQPTLGTIKINGFTLTFTPDAGEIGNDQIALRAGDGNSTSNIATIDIQIQDPSSSAPTLQNVEYTIKPNESAVLNLNLLFKAPHPFAGKRYTFTILQNGKLGTGVISGSNLTYTPILNAFGTDSSMRILVEDDLGQKTETPITIIISNN